MTKETQQTSEQKGLTRRQKAGLLAATALTALGVAAGAANILGGGNDEEKHAPRAGSRAAAEQQYAGHPQTLNAIAFLDRVEDGKLIGEPVTTKDGGALKMRIDYVKSIEQAREDNPGVVFTDEDKLSIESRDKKTENGVTLPKQFGDLQKKEPTEHHHASAGDPSDYRELMAKFKITTPGDTELHEGQVYDIYDTNSGRTQEDVGLMVKERMLSFKLENGQLVPTDPPAELQGDDTQVEVLPPPER